MLHEKVLFWRAKLHDRAKKLLDLKNEAFAMRHLEVPELRRGHRCVVDVAADFGLVVRLEIRTIGP